MCKSSKVESSSTAGSTTSGWLVVISNSRRKIFHRLLCTPENNHHRSSSSSPREQQQQQQCKRLLSPKKSMDPIKLLLCFLLLFHVPFSDRGVGMVNYVASGTLISISTSKGNIILQKEGETTSVLSSSLNVPVPNPNNDKRWSHYETALSNTGPLKGPEGLNLSSSTTTATATTEASLSTSDLPVTLSPLEQEEDSGNTTRKPLNGSRNPANKTYHNSNFNSNNNNLLNNARKYIASYEDLQSRFPDGSPFENNTSINMTVPLGDTAFLRCRVRNLGERSISWIRRRDWHILTTGKTTYTNDERFNVLHVDGTEDWTLQIKFVQKRDNGTYECQVSTGTGIISYFVNLFIAVPEAFILGNGEYHVEQGSNINLVCVIEKSPKPPEFIFWYHNERMINYGNSREVVVKTEPGARTHSRLTIKDARIPDSGNYTCKTAHAEPASIFVYVSQASGLFSGDKMAAIQRRKTSGTSSVSSSADTTSPVQSSTSSGAAAVSVALTAMTTFPTTTAVAISLASVAASLTISSIQLSFISGGGGSSGYFCYEGKGGTSSSTKKASNIIIATIAAAASSSSILMRRNAIIGSVYHHQRKSSNVYYWYATTTANFLLSLFFLIGATVGDVAVTTVQLLLSLLFLPILVFLTAGAQITYFILVGVEPLLLLVLPQVTTYHKRHHPDHHHYSHSSFCCHHHCCCFHHHDYCSSANSSVSFTLQNSRQQQKLLLHQEKREEVEQQSQQQWEYEHQQLRQRKKNSEENKESRYYHDHRRWWFCFSFYRCWLLGLKRHFVILLLPQLLRRLHQQLFLSSSASSSSMDKSLPVFLSIAQSLWTPFSSGFSRFSTTTTTTIHSLSATADVVKQAGAFFVKMIFTGGMSFLLLLCLQNEAESRSQPLYLFYPSNRLGFRTISHLLIFPRGGPVLMYPINQLLFRRPSCLHLLA